MGKKTVLAKKRRGPPPTGKGVQVVVRLQPEPLSALDKWTAKQADRPTRAEAIRRLVEIGLTIRTKSKQAPVERATRARELAAKALERISDPSATQEERVQRRRRLTRGPQEFRDDRVDLPETKHGR